MFEHIIESSEKYKVVYLLVYTCKIKIILSIKKIDN